MKIKITKSNPDKHNRVNTKLIERSKVKYKIYQEIKVETLRIQVLLSYKIHWEVYMVKFIKGLYHLRIAIMGIIDKSLHFRVI